MHKTYHSALETKYASLEMKKVWSAHRKVTIWRALWCSLANAQHTLGLNITGEQIDDMRINAPNIDWDSIAKYENETGHEVVAHIKAFGDVAKIAKPIIHLGATSQYLVCNSELIQTRESINIIANKIAKLVNILGKSASDYSSVATVGLTHLQPAQPITVGRRVAMWGYNIALALENLERTNASLKFLGTRGATGTQASFLRLFKATGVSQAQAAGLCRELDNLISEDFLWDSTWVVTGQTYPRVIDGIIFASLAAVATSIAKMATDIRLLSGRGEMFEPFGDNQVGSSAMPYKRNPIMCERICGLSRYVIGNVQGAFITAMDQWLERSLDDSSYRRVTLAETFLAVDAILELAINVSKGLQIDNKVISKNCDNHMPYSVTENAMMVLVQDGHDRQALHEIVRVASRSGPDKIIENLIDNDVFESIDFEYESDPYNLVGLSGVQILDFIENVVVPIRAKYGLISHN